MRDRRWNSKTLPEESGSTKPAGAAVLQSSITTMTDYWMSWLLVPTADVTSTATTAMELLQMCLWNRVLTPPSIFSSSLPGIITTMVMLTYSWDGLDGFLEKGNYFATMAMVPSRTSREKLV